MSFRLGPFRIALDTQAIEQLDDQEAPRVAVKEPAYSAPIRQHLGPGQRTITLDAVIYKEVLSPGGPAQIELMRRAMRWHWRMPLVSRSLHFYGFYEIEDLKATKTHMLPNGTFQKITTQIVLARVPSRLSIFGISLG
ncbi:hypothetical protein SAMN04488527_101243 [Aliiroseovarius crassostreae]|uniref:Phage tail protein n=1 Tax=Aliiroseovarius crassostreae TaxID=154981 RepID=A0A0N8IBW5_9RHOB|nr:phage tail protein [Aliiroseovarius crassostreae]KPN64243.1 hypothetical protein AKJ29_16540 [Aliiroseovarius crassostreae]SFU30803.1 hypothetical protein SAMN04488527_101243 [Aliiroseovarius crassostreae]